MSVALARKYRPKTFADVAVQSHVSNTLKGAIARGRVAHGYLLCGPRGTGKTTLARVLAMALNCERRAAPAVHGDPGDAGPGAQDGEPCGECTSCRRIWSGSASMDVVEIDAASNRGVDDARELRERAMYAPSGDDRYKVYIVDEAHMLTREAWNALLKVLEEPPPRVVFVFATTEPQKIAQAAAPVLSRLQRFDLKRIGPAEIRERLAAVLDAEGVPYEPDALGVIARAADGGLRDALSLADQVISLGADARVTAARAREALGLVPEEEYLGVLAVVAEGRAGDVFAHVGRLAEAGADFGLFLTGVGDLLRAQLAVTLGGSAPDVTEATRAALAERAEPAHPAHLAPADLVRMLQLLVEAEPRFRKSAQQQLLLETLLVRFALMDRAVALEDVLRGLGDPGGDAAGRAATGVAVRTGARRGRPPATAAGERRGRCLRRRGPAARAWSHMRPAVLRGAARAPCGRRTRPRRARPRRRAARRTASRTAGRTARRPRLARTVRRPERWCSSVRRRRVRPPRPPSLRPPRRRRAPTTSRRRSTTTPPTRSTAPRPSIRARPRSARPPPARATAPSTRRRSPPAGTTWSPPPVPRDRSSGAPSRRRGPWR
jgi:DNA polymerase-3 subunit gamma/tau